MRRTVIAALGVLALVAAACSNSSKPTRPVAKPGQIVTVLSNADGGVRDPVGRRRHAYYDLLAVAPAGDLYVGDGTNNRVLKVPRGGKVTTVLDCDSVFPEGTAEGKLGRRKGCGPPSPRGFEMSRSPTVLPSRESGRGARERVVASSSEVGSSSSVKF